MGIKIGSKKIKEIMYGNKVVLDIYYGSNHVYGREPKSNMDENIVPSKNIIKENN